MEVIYGLEAGELERLCTKPFLIYDLTGVGKLVDFLYCAFHDAAEEIVPPDLVKEIIALSAVNREES